MRVIEEAKKRDLDLVSGTSFGFNVTRIYLTAMHADEIIKPFVRVSVGTETCDEIERLAQAFEAAMK